MLVPSDFGDDWAPKEPPDPMAVAVIGTAMLAWAALVWVFGTWWGNIAGAMLSTWFVYGMPVDDDIE